MNESAAWRISWQHAGKERRNETNRLQAGETLSASQLPRQGVLPASIMESAQAIVEDVKQRGDDALREYCKKFDGVDVEAFAVDPALMDEAVKCVDPSFMAALERAADQIRDFHARQVQQSWFTTRSDGTILGSKVTPVPSAGIYVPGGRAQYPSTVLMDALPAKVAGVKRIVMVTPPQKEGGISPYTLGAARVAGVDEIYAVGGAQAIAALAYGTQQIPRVAKIVGPGNAFVAAAKRLVSGDAGIDMVAGPSEVCVLTDATADATVVAADLMAQAEHDPLATCYLVTCDEAFAEKVQGRFAELLAASPRAEITRASLDDQGVVVVAANMDAAIDAVNTIAPEHLELHCENAMALLGRIENAGAIFVGPWSRAFGRLRSGPESYAAHGRYGAVLQPAFGGRFREAFFGGVLQPRRLARRCPSRPNYRASGRSVGPRAFGGVAPQTYRRRPGVIRRHRLRRRQPYCLAAGLDGPEGEGLKPWRA